MKIVSVLLLMMLQNVWALQVGVVSDEIVPLRNKINHLCYQNA